MRFSYNYETKNCAHSFGDAVHMNVSFSMSVTNVDEINDIVALSNQIQNLKSNSENILHSMS